ncbi:MAG: DUF128 domain-containing protein [Candidatus Hadarchaeota archaeon]
MQSKEKVQRMVFEILSILKEKKNESPLGARLIARELRERGFEIGDRAVRYHLKHLDERGLTRKAGSLKGRIITEKGEEELKRDLVGDRVGFVLGRIEELIYRMSFDLETGEGDVVTNFSLVKSEDLQRTLETMQTVTEKMYAPSPLIKIMKSDEDSGGFEVPEGKIGLVTVCSVTIDGLLYKRGIPVDPKFGGILEIESGEPTRFIDAIAYSGSSLDPLDVFASRKMTSLSKAIETGSGKILANMREIPIVARSEAERIVEKAEEADLNGVIRIGQAAEPLFGLPVDANRVGISVAGGINLSVAVNEKDIEIETAPIHSTVDISELSHIENHI